MKAADHQIELPSQLVVANWKMNMTNADARAYIHTFLPMIQGWVNSPQQIVFCPSFISIFECRWLFQQAPVSLGAQDVYWEEAGAYTGEVSARMIKELASYVIIGHSERRIYRQETSLVIAKKISLSLTAGLNPILCIGEPLEVYERGESKQFLEKQLQESLSGVVFGDAQPIIIAYEPIWALSSSTGRKDASPEYIEEIARFIRQIIARLYNESKASQALILFGGNVTPDSARTFMRQGINGLLVGSASTKPDQFFQILKNIKE